MEAILNTPTVDRRNHKTEANYIGALEKANISFRNSDYRLRQLLRAYQEYFSFDSITEVKNKKKRK